MALFSLGINYWPRSTAMYMWERFDPGSLREDAARIRDYGLDTVRFFLLWERFQPRADTIDSDALRDLVTTMDIFAGVGLRAIPTPFCGHMSGVNWIPTWALDASTPHGRFRTMAGGATSPYGIGDFYADPTLLGAQERLARALGETLREHPALYVWDLGNEFSNMREPSSPQAAADWSARLTNALHETSGAGATGGIHGEDVERDRGIRPSSIARPWDIATMHGYPAYSVFSRGGGDTEVVPYLADLIRGFTGKPLLFSEFGNPACPPGTTMVGNVPCLAEEPMAAYATAVLEKLQHRGAIGAMWWCWSDYAPELATVPPFDLAPHEMRFGIVRADGSEKPVAGALARFAAQRREVCNAEAAICSESMYYGGLPETVRSTYDRYCRIHPAG